MAKQSTSDTIYIFDICAERCPVAVHNRFRKAHRQSLDGASRVDIHRGTDAVKSRHGISGQSIDTSGIQDAYGPSAFR